jgi:hypothetical protein
MSGDRGRPETEVHEALELGCLSDHGELDPALHKMPVALNNLAQPGIAWKSAEYFRWC